MYTDTILFMFSSNVASVRLLKRRGKLRAEKCIGQSRYDSYATVCCRVIPHE